MQYINSDNGANIKRALLDMGKLEMTVEEEPLMVVDENEDEDDWRKIVTLQPSGVTTAMDTTSADFAPCPVSPQDEFYPVGLEEEQVWDSGDYTDVGNLIQNLEDKVANLKANPRINNLQRLPCICHTLQVRIHFSSQLSKFTLLSSIIALFLVFTSSTFAFSYQFSSCWTRRTMSFLKFWIS